MLRASGALGTGQGHLGLYLSPNNSWVVSRLWIIVLNLWMEKPSRPIKKVVSSLASHSKDGFRPKTLVSHLFALLAQGLGGEGHLVRRSWGRGWSSSGGEDVLLLGEEGRGGLSEQGAAPWGLTMPSSSVPGLPQVKPLHSHSRYLTPLPMCSHVPPVCRMPSATFLPSLPSCLTPCLSSFSVCLSVCLSE